MVEMFHCNLCTLSIVCYMYNTFTYSGSICSGKHEIAKLIAKRPTNITHFNVFFTSFSFALLNAKFALLLWDPLTFNSVQHGASLLVRLSLSAPLTLSLLPSPTTAISPIQCNYYFPCHDYHWQRKWLYRIVAM